jgi:hypothetical protein
MSDTGTEAEGIAPEGQDGAAPKPADAPDPYFVRDGKAYTGEGDPIPVEELEGKAAKPEGDEPEKDPKAPAKPKGRGTIGDAWREIKSARREVALELQAVQADRERLNATTREAEELTTLLKTDLRGYLRRTNQDLRALLEADLKETDATPEEKERRREREEQSTLKAEVEALKKKLADKEEAELAQQDIAVLADAAKQRAEEYPRVAARIEKLAHPKRLLRARAEDRQATVA